MGYSLKAWTNPRDEKNVRLYINGTTRSAVYFVKNKNGKAVWSSKANDTPPKFRTGDHYGKVRKDGDAAHKVAEAFGVTLGEKGGGADWDRLLECAASGMIVEE